MDTTTTSIDALSQREREVLALIARGRTNPEIAEALGLRFETVKWYVSEIISKLGVHSREEAAAEWRAWTRPSARFRRRLQALIGLGFATKAGASLVLGGAVAGGIVATTSSLDGNLLAQAEAVPTATPSSRPWPPPDFPDYTPTGGADIVSTNFEGMTVTLGAQETRSGPCFYTRYSYTETFLLWCRDESTLLLVGSHGGAPSIQDSAGTRLPQRPFGVINGVVDDEVTLVRVYTSLGNVIEAEPAPAPASLGLRFKYWIAAVERIDTVTRVEALDASGQVVHSEPLYDPPGTPPRSTPPPPYEQVNFGVSGRADPSTGTVGMGTGTASFSVDGLAHEYRFGVEHDGFELPRVILWCQTGIVPVTWEAGAAANGTGSFVATIPAGNIVCHWNVSADGNVRIFALP